LVFFSVALCKGLELWVEFVADVRATGSASPGFQSFTTRSDTLQFGTQITRSTLAGEYSHNFGTTASLGSRTNLAEVGGPKVRTYKQKQVVDNLETSRLV